MTKIHRVDAFWSCVLSGKSPTSDRVKAIQEGRHPDSGEVVEQRAVTDSKSEEGSTVSN